METPKIFDSELRFCEILWSHEPVKSSELEATFDFLIIAFAIFLFIRLQTKLTTKKKEEAAAVPPAPPAPTKEEVLLTEIRDLLKETKI